MSTETPTAKARKPRECKPYKWDEYTIKSELGKVLHRWDSEGYEPTVFPPESFFVELDVSPLYAVLTRSKLGVRGYANKMGRPINRLGPRRIRARA